MFTLTAKVHLKNCKKLYGVILISPTFFESFAFHINTWKAKEFCFLSIIVINQLLLKNTYSSVYKIQLWY